mmetsp:Transcript_12645/g.36919  ORF Transcript_12645/g.36919 Transcript_12645/m.36919 type:complete len:272 (+) Transcript_12645:1264-2079(+)
MSAILVSSSAVSTPLSLCCMPCSLSLVSSDLIVFWYTLFRLASSCSVCLLSASWRRRSEFSSPRTPVLASSFSVCLLWYASSRLICSFSMMVRFVVISSWLSVSFIIAIFVSLILVAVSRFHFSRSWMCCLSTSVICCLNSSIFVSRVFFRSSSSASRKSLRSKNSCVCRIFFSYSSMRLSSSDISSSLSCRSLAKASSLFLLASSICCVISYTLASSADDVRDRAFSSFVKNSLMSRRLSFCVSSSSFRRMLSKCSLSPNSWYRPSLLFR